MKNLSTIKTVLVFSTVIGLLSIITPVAPAAAALPSSGPGAAEEGGEASNVAVTGVVPSPTTFEYSAAERRYVVPVGVTLLLVDAIGALGAWSSDPSLGMDLEGYVPTKPGQVLLAKVGEDGRYNGGAGIGGGGAAGRNGPITPACTGQRDDASCGGFYAGSGGGATTVEMCSQNAPACTSGGGPESSLLLVAGGGGGVGASGLAAGGCGSVDPGASWNGQNPLPKGNSEAGPLPIVTGTGTVIPGQPAGGGGRSIGRPAGGGTITVGTGATLTGCQQETAGGPVTFSGGVPGSSGRGPWGAKEGGRTTRPRARWRVTAQTRNQGLEAVEGVVTTAVVVERPASTPAKDLMALAAPSVRARAALEAPALLPKSSFTQKSCRRRGRRRSPTPPRSPFGPPPMAPWSGKVKYFALCTAAIATSS